MKIINFLHSYWGSILIIAGILYLSFTPPSTFQGIPTFNIKHLDKIIHFLLYSGLSLVLIYDFQKNKRSNIVSVSFVTFCILFPIVLGGLVEIMQQQFFAPRTAEWSDWFSDIGGVLAGWLVMYLLRKRNSRL